jgi:hypothetical protein
MKTKSPTKKQFKEDLQDRHLLQPYVKNKRTAKNSEEMFDISSISSNDLGKFEKLDEKNIVNNR